MSERERQILESAMDRILPSSPEEPGATTANAIGYVDWLLRRHALEEDAAVLSRGLRLVDSAAMALCGKGFAECTAPEQDRVLLHIQNIPHTPARRFFSLLVRTTLAGFLCPPGYGGNRDCVGWTFIGFAPHPHAQP